MLKTQCFHCWDRGSIPGGELRSTSHAVWPEKKKKSRNKRKIDIFDYRQIRNFYMAKDTINNFKRQSKDCEKVFARITTVKY